VREAHAQQATLPERVEYLENALGESADKHWKELQELKVAHARHDMAQGKHSKDLEALKEAHTQHATLVERVSYIETCIQDSADRHNQELAAAHQRVEALGGRLDGDAAARDRAVQEALAREREHRDGHHASVQDSLQQLQGLMGETAERHARELTSLKDSHGKISSDLKALAGNHGMTFERLVELEKAHGNEIGRHEKELAEHLARIEKFSRRIAMVREVWSEEPPPP